jgi:hypothetical protein
MVSLLGASFKKNANRDNSAVMILRYALLSILFLPLCCQSLLANVITTKFPATSSSLVSTLTSLCAIQFPSSKSEEPELSFVHEKQGNIFDDGNVNGTKQEQSRQRQQQEEQKIYLFSLNWVQESDPEFFLKKDIRHIWEWKDTTLGDGRDFFVPKPKTLMALQQYILENIPNLIECSIISNCARLEVLCSYSCSLSFDQYSREGINKNEKLQEELLARDISNCFISQLDHHRNVSKDSNAWVKMVMQLPINVDRPESVLTRKPPTIDSMQPVSYYDSWWNVTVGPKAILTRLCKVSAGMGSRPRRPDRPVVFRPFSSRDAHILLQLKRTRENIGFSSIGDDISVREYRSTSKNKMKETNKEGEYSTTKQQQKRKLLPMILDYALRAGKAARNSDIVPEIEELKEMTSAESSVCSASDQQTSKKVADAAFEKGIHPLIIECVAKLGDSTNNIDRRIADFRRNAFGFLPEIITDGITKRDDNANNDTIVLQQELRSWLNRRLHEPTIELRSLSRQQNNEIGKINDNDFVGTNENIDSFLSDSLKEIQDELRREHRRRRERIRSENGIIYK